MSDRKNVLIGDENEERVSSLREILETEFLADVHSLESYSDVFGMVRKGDIEWDLVLLARDLHYRRGVGQEIFPTPFYTLKDLDPFLNLACIGSQANPPETNDPNLHLLYICVPSPPLTIVQRDAVANKLEVFLSRINSLDIELEEDSILYEQVRMLSRTRDRAEGIKILGLLIRKFNLPSMDKVIIGRLSQGLSGAKVFRFRFEPHDAAIGERVLKLNQAADRWKFDLEIVGHKLAKKHLGNEYRLHIADLREIEPRSPTPQHTVSHGDWCAICYDYLGGKQFGQFLDLETALVAAPEDLQTLLEDLFRRLKVSISFANGSLNARKWVLDVLLEWLCQNWYSNTNLVKREDRLVWNYEDGPERGYVQFPPYQLSGKNKRFILSFLDSRRAKMGIRFFEDWERFRNNVREFVTRSQSELSCTFSLHRESSVIVSPSHGDLNSNNILLWLDYAHPFLIDFPWYQEHGHALQDFARLEIEIKFGLMDCQEGCPLDRLQAYDYTHSQVQLWQKLEHHLLNEGYAQGKLNLPSGHFIDNVILSLELVMSIRMRAKEVQNQGKLGQAVPSFWNEYRPALLYHTLRAIGYDSLSPFKRLLAVYSAGELLEQCRLK